jgi:hypothetical protein
VIANTISENAPRKSFSNARRKSTAVRRASAHHARERPQKQLAVGIAQKYFLPAVAPAREMINRAEKF